VNLELKRHLLYSHVYSRTPGYNFILGETPTWYASNKTGHILHRVPQAEPDWDPAFSGVTSNLEEWSGGAEGVHRTQNPKSTTASAGQKRQNSRAVEDRRTEEETNDVIFKQQDSSVFFQSPTIISIGGFEEMKPASPVPQDKAQNAWMVLQRRR
jgi:hypothetical protein